MTYTRAYSRPEKSDLAQEGEFEPWPGLGLGEGQNDEQRFKEIHVCVGPWGPLPKMQ